MGGGITDIRQDLSYRSPGRSTQYLIDFEDSQYWYAEFYIIEDINNVLHTFLGQAFSFKLFLVAKTTHAFRQPLLHSLVRNLGENKNENIAVMMSRI